MKPSRLVLLSLVAAARLSGAAASENSIAFLGPKGSYSALTRLARAQPIIRGRSPETAV